jgi:hypothetical protein
MGLFVRDMRGHSPATTCTTFSRGGRWRPGVVGDRKFDAPDRVQQLMRDIHIDDLKSNDKWWFELGMLCREQYMLDNPEMGRLEAVATPAGSVVTRLMAAHKQARSDQLHTEATEGECQYAIPPPAWDQPDPDLLAMPKPPVPEQRIPAKRTRVLTALARETPELLRRTKLPTYQDMLWIVYAAASSSALPRRTS